ncbi:MAG TPA: Nif3-like dinuclear metal center hexameric protein [Flavobacteriales bacterium]|jgi:dinuclear metal center YbgI/SA1388 family protein|nr:Nif3-like dinuclear metal center hexameric protein [Flavobacteriales bacterium]
MKLKELVAIFNQFAPMIYQEAYDNTGIQIGEPEKEIQAALLSLDVTEEVIQEAIEKKCNLIITHHPLLFRGLKRISGSSMQERIVLQAIRNDIMIYSAHTNLDAIAGGVNGEIADRLGLRETKILRAKENTLKKLITFCPPDYIDSIRDSLSLTGAGRIGNYDSCSFTVSGTGTFKPLPGSEPFKGQHDKLAREKEVKLEMIFPSHLQNRIITELKSVHPYEEVAFDIIQLSNTNPEIGSGIIGNLKAPMKTTDFMDMVKLTFKAPVIRHTDLHKDEIETVALCGGSGSFLLSDAIQQKADVFLSSDFKYHDFFGSEGKITILDIGHYESEQFTTSVIARLLKQNLATFAVHFSKVNTNPVNYY